MAVVTEAGNGVPRLITKREPKETPDNKTLGLQAFDDGVKIIAVAILFLAVMYFSLRTHIV